MGNSFFKFKQFTIYQDDNVLKVSTDSVILGSLVENKESHERILDIGAGTGILSLMMAVKFSKAQIEAVEIDTHSYQWLTYNIKTSNYADRISSFNTSIQEFVEKNNKKYDLIISNPPFFADMPLPSSAQKIKFKHARTLKASDFANIICKALNKNSKFYTILSQKYFEILRKELNSCSLSPDKIVLIKWKENKQIERVFARFSTQGKFTIPTTLSVRDINNEYTQDYKNLTSYYYLNSHFKEK